MYWGLRHCGGELMDFSINGVNDKIAFKFTARFSSLTSIVWKNTGTNPDMDVSIQGVDSNGEPDGVDLYADDDISTSSGWVTATLNATLTVGEQYFIVFEPSTTPSGRSFNKVAYILVDTYDWPGLTGYGNYRDHNWQVYTNEGSWTKEEAYPNVFLQYSTVGDGRAMDSIAEEQANYRVGGNEAIRQSFTVSTPFYSDKINVLAEIPSSFGSPSYPSSHLVYTLKKGSTVEVTGIMCSTTNANYNTSLSIGGYAAPWYATNLGYEFSTGLYHLILTASGAAHNNNFWILSVNVLRPDTDTHSTTSFQRDSAKYSYSTDTAQNWTAENRAYEMPLKFSARGIIGTTQPYEGSEYIYAAVCAVSSTTGPWDYTHYSDHSAYFQIPLLEENYTHLMMKKYDYNFSTVHAGVDASTSDNFDSDYSTAVNIKATTGDPSFWWSTEDDGDASSPGMAYAYREMVNFGTSHDAYPAGTVVDMEMETGYLKKIEGLKPGRTAFMYHNIVYYGNRTHIVYMDEQWNIRGMSYNHITESWYDTATFICTTPGQDAHFTPAITVGNDGYLHMFYGCHNDSIRYRKSSASNDLTNWSTVEVGLGGGNQATYPRPHCHPFTGDIYVFYRYYSGGNSYFCFNRKYDSASPVFNEGWSTIFYAVKWMKADSAPSASADNKAIYPVGTKIDDDGNIHLAWTWTYGYLDNWPTHDLGIGYAFSTNQGYNWEDLKKGVRWKAYYTGGDPIEIPSAYYYNTVDFVIRGSADPLNGTRQWGANHDCMAVHPTEESTAGLKRAFFVFGSQDTSDPLLDLRACVAKWDMDNSEWVVSTVTIGGSETSFFDGGSYGGGIVCDNEGTLYYHIGVAPAATRPWGNGPIVYRLISTDNASSWNEQILTGYNDGNYGIHMKKDFSNRQIEGVVGGLEGLYYLRDIQEFPYNRPDGEDVRVVYGGTEIDRTGSLWNSDSTIIKFKLQSYLATNLPYATSGNYYVYHGRATWPT